MAEAKEEAKEIFIFKPPIQGYFQNLLNSWSSKKRKSYDGLQFEIPIGLPSGLYALLFLNVINNTDTYMNSILSIENDIGNEFHFENVLKYIERNRPFSLSSYDLQNWVERLDSVMSQGDYTVASVLERGGKYTKIIYKDIDNKLKFLKLGGNGVVEIQPATMIFQERIIVPAINRLQPALNCESNIVNPSLYDTTCSDAIYAEYLKRLLPAGNTDCKEEAEEKKKDLNKYREKCDSQFNAFRASERITNKKAVGSGESFIENIVVKNQKNSDTIHYINLFSDFIDLGYSDAKLYQNKRSSFKTTEHNEHRGSNCQYQSLHDVGLLGSAQADYIYDNPVRDLIDGCHIATTWGFLRSMIDKSKAKYLITAIIPQQNIINLLHLKLLEGNITLLNFFNNKIHHAVAVYKQGGTLYIIDRQSNRGSNAGVPIIYYYLSIMRSKYPPKSFVTFWTSNNIKFK